MALLCATLQAQGQTITTFAGDGILGAGYTGDGSFATSAQLNKAKSMALDDTGNVYIADNFNNVIRKVNTGSIITTLTGTPTAGFSGDGMDFSFGMYDRPNYIALDANNNIYISDPNNQRIRMINASTGILSTVAGDGNAGYSGDGGPATAAEINYPASIALDAAGNLYIADQNNNVIRKVDGAGIITTIAGTGNTGYTGEGGPATAADLGFPYGLAFDNSGNLHVSLYYEAKVLKIDAATGNITTVAGSTFGYSGDGGPATAAEMSGPWGIAFDYLNNLYIADFENERVRKVSAAGIMTTIAGTGSAGFSGDGGPSTAAKLRGPTDVRVGPDGSVYIAEYNNHVVRRIAGTATNLPVFTGGASQTMTLCMNDPATPINTELAVNDADAGQTLTWSVWQAPLHGTLAAAYTTTATGSAVTPTGLTYMPTAGYTGTDSFKVRVFDGTGYDSTTVVVTINNCSNAVPVFTGGATQSLVMCKDDPATSINTKLAVTDADAGQTLSWTPIAVPAHGTLVVTYSAPSTGGTVTPTGLSYTPTSGYSGTDMFKVRVSDGTDADTTTINVTIDPCIVAVGSVHATAPVLSVFPNPSTGTFTLNLESATSEQADITIVNVVGEQVKQLSTVTNHKTDILLNVPAGVYMLTATTPHGKWSARIAVQP